MPIFSERLTIGRISSSCAQKQARRTRDTGLHFALLRIRVYCTQLETTPLSLDQVYQPSARLVPGYSSKLLMHSIVLIQRETSWGPFLESPETFREHFGWHTSLCIFKTKASRGTKLCSYFNFYYSIWEDIHTWTTCEKTHLPNMKRPASQK